MSLFDALRARARLLFSRRAAEARANDEIAFHIEMESARLVREQGLAPDEARRRALAAFGGVERHKEELRDGRGLSWLRGMRLDLKLGARMLVKHPGLTVVGVVGMAVAVAISAVTFSVIYTALDPDLPLDEGDRVVAIHIADPARGTSGGHPTSLHDLTTWREALGAVDVLGAFRTVERNLVSRGGQVETVRVAEITASGFRVARVPPLLGRTLLDADEQKGATPVVVISYSLWQRRFAGDSAIVGRTLQLGATRHTIVGVMPDGFGFPVNNNVWTPLQLDPVDFERGEAPAIEVFGRLAPGATLDMAQAQLTTITQRLAAAHPETHAALRTHVMPYPLYFVDGREGSWTLQLVQILISMLLVLIGTNVAILVYARTANRAGEIAVRTALGASRGRIVAQLFAEALVLSALAAAVGLTVASGALRQIDALLARHGGEQIPFWMDFGISPGVVLYSAGLAVLGAVIVGVVPALKATRHRVHAGLQQLGMGGSGMRLGRAWTALIVAQVATAVAVLPIALHATALIIAESTLEPVYARRGLLTAGIRLDREGLGTDDIIDVRDDEEFRARFAQRQIELVRRIEAEPGAANALLDNGGPGPGSDRWIRVEFGGARAVTTSDSEPAAPVVGSRVGVKLADPDYFETFGLPVLAGRGLQPADVSTSAKVAVVEQSFVRDVLGGGAAVGLRVRRVTATDERSTAEGEPWYEIVGVVADFPIQRDPSGDRRPRMYLPLVPGEATAPRLLVQVRSGEPARFIGRLREIAVSVDPMLRLVGVNTLEAAMRADETVSRLAFLVVAGVTSSILLLSAAGIYALMSFTVAKRRREIGIRAALGAGSRRVVASILARAAGQIAFGIVVGTVLAAVLVRVLGSVSSFMRDLRWVAIAGLLIAVAVVVATVGLAAALGPARRALRIQPTEALKAE